MGTLEEENAKLLRLAEEFASDDHIRRRAEPSRDQTPEQGLAEVVSCCRMADWLLTYRDPAAKELPPDDLPADTVAILERLHR